MPELTRESREASSSEEGAGPQARPAVYGRTAVRGVAWFALASMIGKASSLLASLVLGWVLTKHDFGLQAIAISIAGFIMVLQDGGASKVLRTPADVASIGRAVGQFSMLLNLIAAGLIVVAAPIAGWAYGEPLLPWLMIIMAVSLPMSNRPLLLRTRLAAELRFREVSRITTIRSLARNGSMVLFALLGAGPFSLALPFIVAAAVEWIVLSRMVSIRLPGRALDRETFRSLIHASKWILLGLIAGALAQTGAGGPVAWLRGTDLAGVLFFGFQLSVAPAILFASGLTSILLPTFARLTDEPERQATAFLRALRMLCLVGAGVCGFAAVTARPLVELFWQGHWDVAIPVVEVIALTVAVRVAGNIGGALLESHRLWKHRALALVADAICALAAAAIGAWLGGLPFIIACLALQRVLFGCVNAAIGGAMVGVSIRRSVWAMLAPHLVIWIIAAGLILGLGPLLRTLPNVLQILILGAAYAVIGGGALWLFFGKDARGAMALLLSRRAAKRESVTPSESEP